MRDPSLMIQSSSAEGSPDPSFGEDEVMGDGDDDPMQEGQGGGSFVREDILAGLARLAEGYDDLRTPRNASLTASREDDLFPNDAYAGTLQTSAAEEDGAAGGRRTQRRSSVPPSRMPITYSDWRTLSTR